ncbi:hypothetical protein [Rhodococcus jostii]|uniref:hypothetical protein n=1 Tax=Rhodococcus jostii TaxID=132919 RepID=UPI000B08A8AF|nr:hypothetical protein [Rhodococcus jostii]
MSGSTGRESSLADQEKMLRESDTGTVYRVYTDRGSGLRERLERDRIGCSTTQPKGRFTVVRVGWRDRLARFSGGVDRA